VGVTVAPGETQHRFLENAVSRRQHVIAAWNIERTRPGISAASSWGEPRFVRGPDRDQRSTTICATSDGETTARTADAGGKRQAVGRWSDPQYPEHPSLRICPHPRRTAPRAGRIDPATRLFDEVNAEAPRIAERTRSP